MPIYSARVRQKKKMKSNQLDNITYLWKEKHEQANSIIVRSKWFPEKKYWKYPTSE